MIFRQTADAQGDFKKTSDDLANSQKILNKQIVDLSAQLGQELLPIKLKIVSAARELVERFSNLSEKEKNLIKVTAGLSAGLLLYVATGPLMTPIREEKPIRGLTSLLAGVTIGLLLAASPLHSDSHDHGHNEERPDFGNHDHSH